MPLIPQPAICKDCNIGMSVVKVQLKCEACERTRGVKETDIHRLPIDWPLCHDEFMSLHRKSKCSKCNTEISDYYPHGRLPLDCLPGIYNWRVFIGGNYASIGNLRSIKDAVYRLGVGFTPILPYDDFQIPQGQVYETDLRLLHNCKYAIFEVTQPGGELFEIARCTEYRVTTLLVYQARGFSEAPPNVKTMLLESGGHEHHSWLNNTQLYRIVDEFLRQKNPVQWQRAVNLMGYKFDEYYVYNKLHLDGKAEHQLHLTGLKIMIPDLRLSEITHEFRITSGNIVEDTFKPQGPEYAEWIRDNATSGTSAEVGVMRFEPPLDNQSSMTNYSFSLQTKNAYIMSKEQLEQLVEQGTDDVFLRRGLEFASKEIAWPIEVFKIHMEFPHNYQVSPQPSVYFGAELRNEGLKMPPDSFTFDGQNAILEVRRPLMYHRYAITWEVPVLTTTA